MDSKGKVAITIAVITVIGGILAGGGATSWTFDFSQTNIGQIGDNIINQYFLDNFGIDLDKARQNCEDGIYEGMEAAQYCDLLT